MFLKFYIDLSVKKWRLKLLMMIIKISLIQWYISFILYIVKYLYNIIIYILNECYEIQIVNWVRVFYARYEFHTLN
jgi:hypothetical protein